MAYVIINEVHPLKWYTDRIGTRIYRGMDDEVGIKIIDKTHARFLCSVSMETGVVYIEKDK